MSEPSQVPQPNFRFGDFGHSHWFTDRSKSSFLLRVYSAFGITHESFKAQVLPMADKLRIRDDVRVEFAIIRQWKMLIAQNHAHSNEAGTLVWSPEFGERAFPCSTYTLIATPWRKDGVEPSEPDVRNRLDQVTGLVRAHLGTNLMREMVYEVVVNADSTAVTISGPVFERPLPCDGPFVNGSLCHRVGEIEDRLRLLRPEKRARIDFALQYFNRALDRNDVFFNFWTALEILCNGKAQKIKTRVGSCYSRFADDRTKAQIAIGRIATMRHDFFHRGRRPVLSADAERYLQMLFLDLLRQEIDLPCLNNVGALHDSSDYELHELGV